MLSGGAASFPLASGFILKIHTQPLRFCSAPSSQQKHIFPLTRSGPRARTQILAKKSFAAASFSQESKLKGMKPSGRKEEMCSVSFLPQRENEILSLAMWKEREKCMKSDRVPLPTGGICFNRLLIQSAPSLLFCWKHATFLYYQKTSQSIFEAMKLGKTASPFVNCFCIPCPNEG